MPFYLRSHISILVRRHYDGSIPNNTKITITAKAIAIKPFIVRLRHIGIDDYRP
jgi:hypothetical protein